MARKVEPQDVPKVQEALKKPSSESGDLQLRNAVNILVEKFTRYEPILEELDQVKNIVAQKRAQISQGASGDLPASAGPAGQIPAIIEFIKPFIEKPDPMRELMLTSMRESIELSRAIKNAVVSRLMAPEIASVAKATAEHGVTPH